MNKEAILEGLLFVVGDEGITLDNIVEIMAITKKEAQELLKNLREEYNKDNLFRCNLILLNNGLQFLSVIAAATN